MKLFYKAGACSLAVNIALQEVGINPTLVSVDLATKTLRDGSNYLDINPAGQVPCLMLDNGQTLTEVAALLQYVGDLDTSAKLLAKQGDFARYQVISWVNVIATELHKTFSPLFNPQTPDSYKTVVHAQLARIFTRLNNQLAKQEYLQENGYSIADIYAFVATGWGAYVGFDISAYLNVVAYREKIAKRPAVMQALKAEGLM